MASALMIVLAASGLVSAAVPAQNTASAAKPAHLVTAAPKAAEGVCMVPVLKGKVTKLSAIRKARDGHTCSYQFMQGGAGGAPRSGGISIAAVGTAVGAGAVAGAVGGAVGGAVAGNNNNTPNP